MNCRRPSCLLLLLLATLNCRGSETGPKPLACGPALPAGASGPRPSSMRLMECDYDEEHDFTHFDLGPCSNGMPCPVPDQSGDGRCHLHCDRGQWAGQCAAGERCEK